MIRSQPNLCLMPLHRKMAVLRRNKLRYKNAEKLLFSCVQRKNFVKYTFCEVFMAWRNLIKYLFSQVSGRRKSFGNGYFQKFTEGWKNYYFPNCPEPSGLPQQEPKGMHSNMNENTKDLGRNSEVFFLVKSAKNKKIKFIEKF